MKWGHSMTVIRNAVALALLGAAMVVSPEPARANSDDGSVCGVERSKGPEASVVACTGVIQAGKESPERLAAAYTVRGEAYLALSRYDEAIKDLDQALRLNPNLAIAYYKRGQAYFAKGQYDQAIRDYDRAGELAPNLGLVLNERCWARAVANKELNVALEACNQALLLDAKDVAALDSRSFVYFRMKEDAKARADCDAALALEPKLASALFIRGLIKKRGGDAAGGDADIAAAKAIDPKIADMYAKWGAGA
jgi:tetratricopeptide (TPR) repeat protein